MPNENDEPSTVGWDAITSAVERLYPEQKARHFGRLLPAAFGGDPLNGISAYQSVQVIDLTGTMSFTV